MPRARHQRLVSIAVLTAVVGGLLLFGRGRTGDEGSAAPHGQDTLERCLERMLDAARAGDVGAYVACFDGELRRNLESAIAAQSPQRAAAELRSGAADLKSFATHGLERPRPGEAVVTLERIYSRRNDLERVRLRQHGGAWRIVELVPVDRVAPPIPYGTPVVPEAGESP
ncbi:MAG TPA: hypothetical protein VML55_07955 [Planctomycetaceae bacterium]|nr:hypothetical protein [Planctomycetaceae bacterium]